METYMVDHILHPYALQPMLGTITFSDFLLICSHKLKLQTNIFF